MDYNGVMHVTKCDVCKSEIERVNKDSASIEFAYKSYAFCRDCREPVVKVLKKYKLIEKPKEGS